MLWQNSRHLSVSPVCECYAVANPRFQVQNAETQGNLRLHFYGRKSKIGLFVKDYR